MGIIRFAIFSLLFSALAHAEIVGQQSVGGMDLTLSSENSELTMDGTIFLNNQARPFETVQFARDNVRSNDKAAYYYGYSFFDECRYPLNFELVVRKTAAKDYYYLQSTRPTRLVETENHVCQSASLAYLTTELDPLF